MQQKARLGRRLQNQIMLASDRLLRLRLYSRPQRGQYAGVHGGMSVEASRFEVLKNSSKLPRRPVWKGTRRLNRCISRRGESVAIRAADVFCEET
jgi:hypothetical protein